MNDRCKEHGCKEKVWNWTDQCYAHRFPHLSKSEVKAHTDFLKKKKKSKIYLKAESRPCSRCGQSINKGNLFVWDGLGENGFRLAHPECV